MSKELQQRLRSVRTAERQISPDPAWVRATRETLLMQIKNTLPEQSMGATERVQTVFRVFGISRMSAAMRKPVMAFASFLLVVLGGSIFSVSAAERSLPGDFFYGLKLVTEQARLALTTQKDEKLKLKTEFTERRVSELQQIVKQKDGSHREQVAQVADILKQDLGTLKQQLGDVSKDVEVPKVVAAAKLVDQKANEVMSALQEAKDQLPADSKEKVTEAQSAAADTGMKAIEVLTEKHQESSENIPASDIAQAIQDHTKIVVDVTSALVLATTSSTTSTVSLLPPLNVSSTAMATSTEVTSTTLPMLVGQAKDLTTQAFAIQKAKDQLEAAASVLSNIASSSTSSTNEGGAQQPGSSTQMGGPMTTTTSATPQTNASSSPPSS